MDLMDLSEEKTVIRQAKRDPEIFGLLFDRYYQSIFGYVLRRTANIALAQDLTSETFTKALKHLPRFRWQNVPFSAWLYRIASNEVNLFYRKQKRFSKIDLDDLPEIPDTIDLIQEIETSQAELQKKKDYLELHKIVSKLAPMYQTVIALRFFEKKKISEISQIIGRPQGTIKSQLHRALKQLRNLMPQEQLF